jgi:hypothetical protein
MVHDLKFYRAIRPTSPIASWDECEEYVKGAAIASFNFSLDDEEDRAEDGSFDAGLFIETILDYALGSNDVEGWTETFDQDLIGSQVFLIVDETASDERISNVIWPASVIEG